VKALSFRQPWAWAILNRGKDIENRTWNTNFRGEIYIHASKTFDLDGQEYLLSKDICSPTKHFTQKGGIVGTVEIVDCVTKSDSEWFFGPYGFVFENPKEMLFTPYKGQLGFFNVDDL